MSIAASNRRKAVLLAAIIVLAAALRFGALALSDNSKLTGPDASTYDQLALNVAEGNGYYHGGDGDPIRSFRPVLFPLYLAGIYATIGYSYIAAKIGLIILSCVTVALVYFLGSRVAGNSAGIISALLFAVYPKFIYYSIHITTETLYTFFLVLTVYLLFVYQQRGTLWNCVVGGIACGLAILTRSVLAGFVPVIMVWLICVSRGTGKRLIAALIFAVACTAVMSPWIIRNYRIHHAFVPTTTEGGYTFWLGHNPRTTGGGECYYPEDPSVLSGLGELERDKLYWRMGIQHIRENPWRTAKMLLVKFSNLWRPYPHVSFVGWKTAVIAGVSFVPILLLAIYGLSRGGLGWRNSSLFVLLFIYYSGMHSIFPAVSRYRVPIMPFIIVLASVGLLRIFTRRTAKEMSP